MPLYNKTFSSLVGGVSQQPDSVRFDSQHYEQINGFPSPAQGLQKRYPTDYVSDIGDSFRGAFTHFVDRNPSERYFFGIKQSGSIAAADIEGNTIDIIPSVDYSGTYLDIPPDADPRASFRALTIGDSTIIINTTKTVAQGSLTSPVKPFESLVYVKEGKFGKNFKIELASANDNLVASYTVPDGSSSGHTVSADTSNIATELTNDLVTLFVGAVDNWSVVTKENIIHITNDSGDFSISTTDGFADQAMYPIKDKISLFSDLPRKAPSGFIVEVTGSEGSVLNSSYYAVATPNGTEPELATAWANVDFKETIAGGLTLDYDVNTMPHLLKLEAGGNLSLEPIDYGKRIVGNDDTSPLSGFIGSTISNLFFFKNRLGFIYNESIIISESGNFFNFYPTSVATLLTADPIEYTVNVPNVSKLEYAIPFNEQLILSSDKHQYVLTSEGILSNETISITPTTDFSVSKLAAPVASGSFLFYATNEGNYSEVREYYITETINSKNSSNITAHVPTYIPKDIIKLKASLDATSLIGLTDDDFIYVYKYLWSGNDKVQSAWFKYELGGAKAIDAHFIDDSLYIIADYRSGTSLLSTRLTASLIEEDKPFIVYLDSRIKNGSNNFWVSYNPVTDQTTISLPYRIREGESMVVVSTSDDKYGEVIDSTTIDILALTSIHIKGDVSNDDFVVGIPYEFYFEPSSVYIKEQQGQGSKARTVGKTQVTQMIVNYDRSSSFEINVDIQGRSSKSTKFNGRVKGDNSNVFGTINPISGKLNVQIGSLNDKVTLSISNKTHLPSNILFLDFVLRYWSTVGQTVG